MEEILRREVGAQTQHPRTMDLHRLVARVHSSHCFGSFTEDKLYMTVENNHRFVIWWNRHPDDWVRTYYVTAV